MMSTRRMAAALTVLVATASLATAAPQQLSASMRDYLFGATGAGNASYNVTTATDLVWASAVAYCDESAISSWNCKACAQLPGLQFVKYAYDQDKNVAAYVASAGGGAAVVSFRGTDPSSLRDWIDDLSFKKVDLPGCSGCEVHEGFYHSYLALQSQVMDGLASISGLTTVAITGHSLGAAMACHAAWDLSQKGYDVRTMYAYGQPRVGNAAFADAYAGAVSEFRVVHYKDIVPHLPMEVMGFHHVPTEVFYNEASTSYQVCNGSGEDDNCSDGLTLPDSIDDHLHYLNIAISGSC